MYRQLAAPSLSPRGAVASCPADKSADLIGTCISAGAGTIASQSCWCPAGLKCGAHCRWEPRGGKSNSFFAKTRDDRFIVKQLSAAERKSFQELAPNFFGYLGRAMRCGQPTCLAKIMGVFTVGPCCM